MNTSDLDFFQTTTHAKWILTGEHSVLRQGDAIVFPLLSKTLTLHYQKRPCMLRIKLPKQAMDELSKLAHPSKLKPLCLHTIEYGLQLLGRPEQQLTGVVSLSNHIAVGMGMGFSAALCVALARLFVWKEWLEQAKVFEFSKRLENHLHGTSSGIDIIGSSTDVAAYYNCKEGQHPIALTWQPIIYLSHSQKKSLTAHCITKVQRSLQNDPKLAQVIDRSMHYSTIMAHRALTSTNSTERLPQLVSAIEQASNCFQQWGLIPQEVARHIDLLKQHGALAAKPTGAGNGGYVLSLWQKPLPSNHRLPFEMIAATESSAVNSS